MPSDLGQYRLLKSKTSLVRKAFPVQSSHTFAVGSAVFDEPNLVSAAGLVPVMELAEQTGLSRLIGEHVELPSTRVASGAVNAAGKLTTIIAGMMCGADSIDDANVLRAGGTPRVFDEVYAPSTVGILLREFTFGHSNQLAAVAREHLIALAQRTPLLAGTDERMFLDIDSLLRPVYGHQKQGASFGHAKIAGRALLRKGLSPLVTTLSVPTAAPVIAEAGLRGGKTGPRRGVAGRRPARPRARGRPPTQARDHHRPSDRPGRHDHGPGRLRVRHHEGHRRLPGRAGRVLADPEPQPPGHHGDRGHRRRRVHPGALSGRGGRPRHRRVDL